MWQHKHNYRTSTAASSLFVVYLETHLVKLQTEGLMEQIHPDTGRGTFTERAIGTTSPPLTSPCHTKRLMYPLSKHTKTYPMTAVMSTFVTSQWTRKPESFISQRRSYVQQAASVENCRGGGCPDDDYPENHRSGKATDKVISGGQSK